MVSPIYRQGGDSQNSRYRGLRCTAAQRFQIEEGYTPQFKIITSIPGVRNVCLMAITSVSIPYNCF